MATCWRRIGVGKLKSMEELFEGRHFDREVIILCVRWYLRFKLSLRDLAWWRVHSQNLLCFGRWS